jgi:acyl dehydratase
VTGDPVTSDPGPRTGLHYEEFRVGRRYETGPHAISRAEIAEFARLTGDDNPLHTRPEVARAAGFRDVLAHGMFLQSLTLGLIAATGIMRGTTIALLGGRARFLYGAYAGDTVQARFTISRKRPTRAPDRGLVWRQVELVNQDGAVVATFSFTALVRRLPRAPEPGPGHA